MRDRARKYFQKNLLLRKIYILLLHKNIYSMTTNFGKYRLKQTPPPDVAAFTHDGDADKTEATVKEITGADNAAGFDADLGDDSVNVTVADGSKVNVPKDGTVVIIYDYAAKTWSTMAQPEFADKYEAIADEAAAQ